MFHVKKGLDLKLKGSPILSALETKAVKTVAVTGPDYIGMKPTIRVVVGDLVKKGQLLFECKKNEGLAFTSPAAGKVIEINRGEKRKFLNLVIEIADNEESVSFSSFTGKPASEYKFEEASSLLQEAGLWSALRTRPFSKSAPVDGTKPHSIFITASDTNPHAVDPSIVIAKHTEAFAAGVKALSLLTEGKTYVCKVWGNHIPLDIEDESIILSEFKGPHPAGNVGTHIHYLDPVSATKTVWHMSYQDVISVGKLFLTGELFTDRIISIAGPCATNPRLIQTRLGANIAELVEGEFCDANIRIVSGSLLNGRTVTKDLAYLGRFHSQISIIEEGTHREFLGWHDPGFEKFSIKRTFLSFFDPSKVFNMTTTTHGSLRSMVPVGTYEAVMPLDILPTQLLRALLTYDSDGAIELGCLELDEEDLALCTFASPGKKNFGPFLRENLSIIEKEG